MLCSTVSGVCSRRSRGKPWKSIWAMMCRNRPYACPTSSRTSPGRAAASPTRRRSSKDCKAVVVSEGMHGALLVARPCGDEGCQDANVLLPNAGIGHQAGPHAGAFGVMRAVDLVQGGIVLDVTEVDVPGHDVLQFQAGSLKDRGVVAA